MFTDDSQAYLRADNVSSFTVSGREDKVGTIADRLQQVMKKRGLTASELARELKIRPQAISQWLSGSTRSPSASNLVKAARILGVSPEWLTEGRGSMTSSPELGVGHKNETAPFDRNVSAYTPSKKPLRVLARVVAGDFKDGIQATTDDEPWYEAPECSNPGPASVWLIVDGTSMDDGSPEGFRQGDLILVDPDAGWGSGDFVIIANGGDEWTFKRIRKDGPTWFMEAMNPGYAPRVRAIPEGWRVVGRVVEVKPKGRKV